MENREYVKRSERRRLNAFQECKALDFAVGATGLVFLFILVFNVFSFAASEASVPTLAAAGLFLAESLIIYALARAVKAGILKTNGISKALRASGFLLCLMVLTGNVFAFAAGLTLVKKQRTIEYHLGIYMILTDICVILVSALNLFKPGVADTFVLGMYSLTGLTVLHTALTIFVSRAVGNTTRLDKKLRPLGWICLLTCAGGNLFAFLLGIVILRKTFNESSEISIEWIDIIKRLFRNNTAVIGLFFVGFLLSVSICSYLTFDYGMAIDNNYSAILSQPSLAYPFGTDNFGRCVFTRIVFGARISLTVGVAATAVPFLFGGVLGAIAGYYGKMTDNIIMRVLDVLLAIPDMLLAVAIVASLGAGVINLIMALSIYYIPVYARIIRAQVMTVSGAEYVEASKASGAKEWEIILKQVIPNSISPLIVRATLQLGFAVLSTSSLSFLGLGVAAHIPEWGNILKIGSAYLESNPYIAIYPGIAIILLVLSFNFFGDGMRDAMDPKLK